MKFFFRLFIALVVLSAAFTQSANAHENGTHSIKSKHSASETMSRLENIVTEKGFHIFAKVDHQAGAKKVGKAIRHTELLIFGNPKGGTVLMQCNQMTGLDLPLKYLVREDDAGQVWIDYNESDYLAKRHKLGKCGAQVVTKVGNVLELIATVAGK